MRLGFYLAGVAAVVLSLNAGLTNPARAETTPAQLESQKKPLGLNPTWGKLTLAATVGYVQNLPTKWNFGSGHGNGAAGYGADFNWAHPSGFGLSVNYLGFDSNWQTSQATNYAAHYHVVAVTPSYRFSLGTGGQWGVRVGVGLGFSIARITIGNDAMKANGTAKIGARATAGAVYYLASYNPLPAGAGTHTLNNTCHITDTASDDIYYITDSKGNHYIDNNGTMQSYIPPSVCAAWFNNVVNDTSITTTTDPVTNMVQQTTTTLNPSTVDDIGLADYLYDNLGIRLGFDAKPDIMIGISGREDDGGIILHGTKDSKSYDVNISTDNDSPISPTVIAELIKKTSNNSTIDISKNLTIQSAYKFYTYSFSDATDPTKSAVQTSSSPPAFFYPTPDSTTEPAPGQPSAGGSGTKIDDAGLVLVPQVAAEYDNGLFHADLSFRYIHELVDVTFNGQGGAADAVQRAGPLTVFVGAGFGLNF